MSQNTISVSPLPQGTSQEKIKEIFGAFSVKNIHIERNTAYIQFADQGDLETLDIQFDNYQVAELNNAVIDKTEFDWSKVESQTQVPSTVKSQSSGRYQDLMGADVDQLGYGGVKPTLESYSGDSLGYGSRQEKPTHNVLHEDIIPPFDKKTSMETNFLNQQSRFGYKEEHPQEAIPQVSTRQELDYTTEVKVHDDQHLGYSPEVQEAARQREEEEKRKVQQQHQRKLEEEHKLQQQRKKKQEDERRQKIQLEQRQKKQLEELRKKKQQQDLLKKKQQQELLKKKQQQELQRKRQEEQRKRLEQEQLQRKRLEEELRRKKQQQELQKIKQQQEQRRKQQQQNRRRQEQEAKRKMQEERKKRIQQERLSQELKEKLDAQKEKFKTQTEKIGYQEEEKHQIPTEGQVAVKETEVLRDAEQSIEKQLGYAVNKAKEESAHLLQAGLDLLKGNQKEQGKKLEQAVQLGYEKEGPKEIGLKLIHSGLDFLKDSYQKFQEHLSENSGIQPAQKMGYENWSVKPEVGVIKPAGGQQKVLRTLITVTLLIWVIFLLLQDTSSEVLPTSEIGIPTV